MISSKIAKTVFDHMVAGEGEPAAIVEKHGLVQVTDTGAIEATVDKIIAANPDKAEAVKERPQALGWFVGQVMRETGGKANPAAVMCRTPPAVTSAPEALAKVSTDWVMVLAISLASRPWAAFS